MTLLVTRLLADHPSNGSEDCTKDAPSAAKQLPPTNKKTSTNEASREGVGDEMVVTSDIILVLWSESGF